MRFFIAILILCSAVACASPVLADIADPPSNADLKGIIRTMNALAIQGRTCSDALEAKGEQCLRRDCQSAQRLLAEIGDVHTILAAMLSWQRLAKRDAYDHQHDLLEKALTDGQRKAQLQTALWQVNILQDLGKLLLNIADFVEFAKGLKESTTEVSGFLEKPETFDIGAVMVTLDWLDSIQDTMLNMLDTANILVSQARENGFNLPPWLDQLLTIRQVITDLKDIGKGMVQGANLLRKARALKREAMGLFYEGRAAKLAEAAAMSDKGVEKLGGGMAAVGQIVGKVLLVVSAAQVDDMKNEIKEIEDNYGAELGAIARAAQIYGRRAARFALIEDAMAATLEAVKAMKGCVAHCVPLSDIHEGPKIPGFKDSEGKEQYGKALAYLTDLLKAKRADVATAYAAFTPRVTDAETPRISTFHPSQTIAPGGRIRMEFDVDECTAEGEVDAGGGAVPFGGQIQGQVVVKAPAAEGQITLTFRRNGETVSSQPLNLSVDEDAKIEDCGQINCDCDNVDWGLLTKQYREQCVAVEESLKAECAAKGYITGSCDEAAQGPYAFPP